LAFLDELVNEYETSENSLDVKPFKISTYIGFIMEQREKNPDNDFFNHIFASSELALE